MTNTRERSAAKAGFTYLQIPITSGPAPKQWVCPRNGDFLSVERAVLSHFAKDGWQGYWREGGLLLSLIKAMSFPEFGHDERTRYIEALYTIAADPSYGRSYTVPELLENVAKATPEQISANFDHMDSSGPFVSAEDGVTFASTTSLQYFFPGLESWMLLELFDVAGRELIHQIATIFATDPYEYRRGWPDLTIWKDGMLRFVEVKAPGDSLGKSQKVIAQTFARPLGLDFMLVDVVHVVT